MNKKQYIIIISFLFITGCELIENIKKEYIDWDSLLNAPKNEKGWFPPLFNKNLPFQNIIFNIIIVYDLDTNNIWGRFEYSNDFLNSFSFQINPYENNYYMIDRDKRRIRKIGFDDNKIDLYFTENIDKETWYYFINTNEKCIYFCNFIFDYRNH